MPNIFKFFEREAKTYVPPPAEDLEIPGGGEDGRVQDPPPGGDPPETEDPGRLDEDFASREGKEKREKEHAGRAPDPDRDPVSFARIQADAILRDARREAEEYREKTLKELGAEVETVKAQARREGYAQGYAQGMGQAMAEGKQERNRLAAQQVADVQKFLEEAARQRDQLLDDSREELKDLALAIAEKVIRVSLRGSSDIILRMVDAATDTHKRCEWARIYIADCDVRGKASAIPELTRSLRHLSSRVKVIPMADDESGTCIVELPDAILDASVSTQLGNIREVLSGAAADRDERQ